MFVLHEVERALNAEHCPFSYHQSQPQASLPGGLRLPHPILDGLDAVDGLRQLHDLHSLVFV